MNPTASFLRRALRPFVCGALPLTSSIALSLSSVAFAQEEGELTASDANLAEGSESASASGEASATDGSATDGSATDGSAVDGSGEASGGSLFESAGSDVSVTSDSGDVALELNGYVRGDVYVGVLPGTSEPGINAAYGELSFQPKIKKGDWGSAFADLRFRYGQQLDRYDLFVDLREAYVNAYFGPVDLRLGKQVIAWGRANGFNPTSNLAPIDFRIRSPVEDDRRIGNMAARMFVNLLPVRIEGVWLPLYQATEFPTLQLEPGISFVDPSYPVVSLRNGTFAGKVNVELPSFEASLSYFNGNAPLPGLKYVDHQTGPEYYVQIQRASYRQHVIGADFAAVVGDLFGLTGEAALRIPMNQATTPWAAKQDMQWVLGIEREFGDVMIIAQYLGRYTFDWQPQYNVLGSVTDLRDNPAVQEDGPNAATVRAQNTDKIQQTIFNYNRIIFNQKYQFQTLASLRVEWKTLQERLSISALGLVNFNTSEWALFPKVSYRITGGLTGSVGAEIYMGPDDTLFGMIEDDLTAGYAELRLSF